MASNERSKTWAFLVYPDSAPKEWKRLLQLECIPCAISPLHNPDLNSDPSESKEHWHIMLQFDSLKSFDQVKQISTTLHGCNPVILNAPSGYFKYMIHKENPDKQQFTEGFKAIETYNGFNPDQFEKFTKKQIRSFKKDITILIEKNNITEYETLICFIRDNFDSDDADCYFDLVTTNTIFFNSFLCSRRNRIKQNQVDNVNKRISKIEERLNKWIQN